MKSPILQKPDFLLAAERRRADLAVKARNDLIATAAHDLRSPLNGIQGWAHVLQGRLGDSPLLQRALDGIRNGVEQQVRLISDLTDALSVMNANLSLQPQTVPLLALVQRELEALADSASEREIALRIGGQEAPAWADAGRLSQALAHVFGHVLRAARSGEQIRVAVSSQPGETVLLIDGQDERIQGKAVPEAVRPPRQSAGLLLAWRLIELNGGRVQAEPLDDDGVRQRFRISLAQPPDTGMVSSVEDAVAQGLQVAARAQVSLGAMRIVLVKGPGWQLLKRKLQALDAALEVIELAQWQGPLPRCDLALLPAATAASQPPADVALLAYDEGSHGQPAVVSAQTEPLRLAALVLTAVADGG